MSQGVAGLECRECDIRHYQRYSPAADPHSYPINPMGTPEFSRRGVIEFWRIAHGDFRCFLRLLGLYGYLAFTFSTEDFGRLNPVRAASVNFSHGVCGFGGVLSLAIFIGYNKITDADSGPFQHRTRLTVWYTDRTLFPQRVSAPVIAESFRLSLPSFHLTADVYPSDPS